MTKQKSKMKLFTRRDTVILLVLWNIILLGSIILVAVVQFSHIDETRRNTDVRMQVEEDLRQRIVELEQ